MKIGLTADLHFDDYASLSRPSDDFLTSRLEDMLLAFRGIVKACVKDGCEKLFILGDIFESRVSLDVSVLDLVCREFRDASDKIELTILAGNHDSYMRSACRNSSQAFLGVARVVDRPMTYGDFAFVPWMEDANEIKKAVDKVVGKAPFLFSHLLLEGSVPKKKGLPASILRPEEFNQIFLGDVHAPMLLESNIQYVGSPYQIDFRDAGSERGFWILDMGRELVFCPNDVSPQFHILGDKDSVKAVRQGDYVRVKTAIKSKAEKLAKAAREITDWVEGENVELEDTAPRLGLTSRDSYEDAIKRYAEHQGKGDDIVIDAGMKIMAEAGESA